MHAAGNLGVDDRSLGKCPLVSIPNTTDVKAVLLVGGLGTRLRAALPGTPKALAAVGDRPFLELLVRQLSSQGIRRLVMCTGHLAEQIEKEFGQANQFGVTVEFSRENSPLGTAGAVKLAETYLASESEFLVMNGDSFVEVDLRRLLAFHRSHRALVTIVAARVPDTSRFGTLKIGTDGSVLGFLEKTGKNESGMINAGVYVFANEVLREIPQGPSSLEKDVIPKLLSKGVIAFESEGLFIDIGTPDDYLRANSIQKLLASAAHGTQSAPAIVEGQKRHDRN